MLLASRRRVRPRPGAPCPARRRPARRRGRPCPVFRAAVRFARRNPQRHRPAGRPAGGARPGAGGRAERPGGARRDDRRAGHAPGTGRQRPGAHGVRARHVERGPRAPGSLRAGAGRHHRHRPAAAGRNHRRHRRLHLRAHGHRHAPAHRPARDAPGGHRHHPPAHGRPGNDQHHRRGAQHSRPVPQPGRRPRPPLVQRPRLQHRRGDVRRPAHLLRELDGRHPAQPRHVRPRGSGARRDRADHRQRQPFGGHQPGAQAPHRRAAGQPDRRRRALGRLPRRSGRLGRAQCQRQPARAGGGQLPRHRQLPRRGSARPRIVLRHRRSRPRRAPPCPWAPTARRTAPTSSGAACR